ncbi:MAG: hypothetical protein RLZZ299_2932 [Pseudomonadota bacterium]
MTGFALLVPILAACAPEPERVAVRGVAPDVGWYGEETPVRIDGDGFLPVVRVGDGVRLDSAFGAWLVRDGVDDVPLTGVSHESYDVLVARVPAGLALGPWGVRVTTPGGGVATLEDAFRVTDTRADHLALVSETAAYTVGEPGRLVIRVLDPNGVRVPSPLEIAVRAASATGASGVRFLPGGLDGVTALPGGVGVQGRLDADGEGVLLVASDVPDDVTFAVEAVDAAAGVTGDSALLSWQAGGVARIDVELPFAGFEAVAGTSFPADLVLRDASGNVLEDEVVDVLLYERCGDLREAVEVRGRTRVEVSLTAACSANALGVFAQGGEWSSAVFPVRAGEAAGYRLDAIASSVTAGTPEWAVRVAAVDPWGNVARDVVAALSFRDDLGGLDTSRGIGRVVCPGFPASGDAQQRCVGTLVRAGSARVTVTDGQGRDGVAEPVEVLPGPLVRLEVEPSATSVEAGSPFTVRVRGADAWDNTWPVDPVALVWSDDTGTLACEADDSDPGGGTWICVATAATPDAAPAVRMGTVESVAFPLAVRAGPMVAVEVEPVATRVQAGARLPTRFTAWDAWGNRATFEGPRVLALSVVGAEGDTPSATPPPVPLTPAAVELAMDGEGTADLVLVRAGRFVVAVEAGLGATPPLEVVPGALASLDVRHVPWTLPGLPTGVDVLAHDVWGNAVPGEAPAVRDPGGGCACAAPDALGEGRWAAACTCDGSVPRVSLEVQAGAVLATSPLHVLRFGCDAAPDTVLRLDGEPGRVACTDPSPSPVVAQLSDGGAPDATSVTVAWVRVADAPWQDFDPEGRAVLAWPPAGAWRVEAVAADAAGCATRVTAGLWLGPPGAPLGPVDLVAPSDAQAGDVVTVDLLAHDCAGGPASGALGVRVDAGVVDAPVTGRGRVVPLDSDGSARVDWSVGGAGLSALEAGTPDGWSWGRVAVDVSGEGIRPRVARVAPEGRVDTTVDRIDVRFTAPMQVPAPAGAVELLDPDGVPEAIALTWSTDGRELTVTPLHPLDPARGPWSLTLAASLTGANGRALDGTGEGAAAARVVRFGGDLPAAPQTPACSVGATRITPDGDDGPGDEADTVSVAVTSDVAPARWTWWVADAGGAWVRTGATGGSATRIAWDGRDDAGRVVTVGSYVLAVEARDAEGSASPPCRVGVVVAQHLAPPRPPTGTWAR